MTTYITEKKRYKWLIPVTAISALLLVILLALGILGGEQKIAPGLATGVGLSVPKGAKTQKVTLQPTVNLLSWQGTIRSRVEVKISPKLNARIMDIRVHPGDHLNKGDIIARLDDRELQAAFNAANAAYMAAQAQATQAKTEENRINTLYAKQAATKQNYDAVISQSKLAQALANQAASNAQQNKVLLGENVLYAPFAGVIGERLQEPGDMGIANQPIVTLLKPDDLRLDVAVADSCAQQIKLGMTVNVRIDALQEMITGKIDEITPEIDAKTRNQQLKVSLPKISGLQQGQLAWLALACQAEQSALLIPASAVEHFGQLQAVKVVEDGLVHTRHIRTGKQYGEQLEVLSGLQGGETILVEGGSR